MAAPEHYSLEVSLTRRELQVLGSIARTYFRVYRLLTYAEDLERAKLVRDLIAALAWEGDQPEDDTRKKIEESLK